MNNDGYTHVVAVKCDKTTERAYTRFCICYVPDGAFLNSGDIVLYSAPGDASHKRGVCVSDVLYVPRDTLEMVCRITSTSETYMPSVVGKVEVIWYKGGRMCERNYDERTEA